MSGRDRDRKVFTIRGLDPELYERFLGVAKELGLSVGELMNTAMKSLLALIIVSKEVGERVGREISRLGSELITAPAKTVKTLAEGIRDYELVTGVSEINISREDLESLDKPVVFINMRRLVFEDDVTWDLIDSKVRSIRLVDEVVIPKHIPKVKLARKCLMVKKIVSR